MIRSEKGEVAVKGKASIILQELEDLIFNLREEGILKAVCEAFKRKPEEYKVHTFYVKDGAENIIKQLRDLRVPKDVKKRILKEMF